MSYQKPSELKQKLIKLQIKNYLKIRSYIISVCDGLIDMLNVPHDEPINKSFEGWWDLLAKNCKAMMDETLLLQALIDANFCEKSWLEQQLQMAKDDFHEEYGVIHNLYSYAFGQYIELPEPLTSQSKAVLKQLQQFKAAFKVLNNQKP